MSRPTVRRTFTHIGYGLTSPSSQCDGRIPSAASLSRPTTRRTSAHIGQVSTSPRSQCDGRIPSAASPSTHDTDAPRHSVSTSVRCRRRRHVHRATDVYRPRRHRQPTILTHLATHHPSACLRLRLRLHPVPTALIAFVIIDRLVSPFRASSNNRAILLHLI